MYYPWGFCEKYDQWWAQCRCTYIICTRLLQLCYTAVALINWVKLYIGSQTTSKWNVKVSISDYPKFTGLAKDWISFERKFRSVASLQGFEYVLQEEEYEPVTENGRSSYKLDLTFICDAFQNSWADSMKFYLVEQNNPTKNGRKVYLDVVNYFRGNAVKDAILNQNMKELMNQNMKELMNYKLTPNTFIMVQKVIITSSMT